MENEAKSTEGLSYERNLNYEREEYRKAKRESGVSAIDSDKPKLSTLLNELDQIVSESVATIPKINSSINRISGGLLEVDLPDDAKESIPVNLFDHLCRIIGKANEARENIRLIHRALDGMI